MCSSLCKGHSCEHHKFQIHLSLEQACCCWWLAKCSHHQAANCVCCCCCCESKGSVVAGDDHKPKRYMAEQLWKDTRKRTREHTHTQQQQQQLNTIASTSTLFPISLMCLAELTTHYWNGDWPTTSLFILEHNCKSPPPTHCLDSPVTTSGAASLRLPELPCYMLLRALASSLIGQTRRVAVSPEQTAIIIAKPFNIRIEFKLCVWVFWAAYMSWLWVETQHMHLKPASRQLDRPTDKPTKLERTGRQFLRLFGRFVRR